MLRFVQRGEGLAGTAQLPGYPDWLAGLLAVRGIDDVEKAKRFLHPTLDHLHDPFLMQGMEKAVALIQKAIAQKDPIVIYGDYDVDGVCASAILMETLQEIGGDVRYYIPSRHQEGYGLNIAAIQAVAEKCRMLITVDCGITNIGEVKAARELGMTVIVTDHHQLGEVLPPAHAILNPLMGEYPFRRLCGAGVAFKLGQALVGLPQMEKRLELCALATVADIVPLIDENRVLVKEGLKRMPHTGRPGLAALMEAADVSGEVTAGQVGFRLAPRLNAGGRLAEAAQGVRLLLTQDKGEGVAIATNLNEENTQRQQMEQEIVAACLEKLPEQVDFFQHRAIVVLGEDWNSGVIGLAASRLCERFHYPTIVLAMQEDGLCVGSARSIPGVNIHKMLTQCQDLFVRFGGHEQAAGLTMESDLVPELRRRLSLYIRKECDDAAFIPVKEYDLRLTLGEVTTELIQKLEMFQPTGFGNPGAVFLTRDAQVQSMRPVGKEGAHLKLSLLDGDALRDGIAFSQGELAKKGLQRVDCLFTPELNTWNGVTTPQLQVKAILPAEGIPSLPEESEFFPPFLQEIDRLSANIVRIALSVDEGESPLNWQGLRREMKGAQGVLLIARSHGMAYKALTHFPQVEVLRGAKEDPIPFHTLLCLAELEKLQDIWETIVLLDGVCYPLEEEAIQSKCPRARILKFPYSGEMKAMIHHLALADEPLRELYRQLRKSPHPSLHGLSQASGLTPNQTLMGLYAFSEVGLAKFQPTPFTVELLPPKKCSMADSPMVAYVRNQASLK